VRVGSVLDQEKPMFVANLLDFYDLWAYESANADDHYSLGSLKIFST
jgi:hypothetical protein